jgi:rare lipoprotein A
MKFIGKIAALSGAILLASCSGIVGPSDGGGKRVSSLPPAPAMESVSDATVKIGEPYTVGGKTYVPQDVTAYDEVGYASWYGDELEGRPTANGEAFVANAVSVAHKTLPMPSYVEITALDSGKTIIARVNDRGPFAHDRLIDLSAGAARELGIMGQGVSGVRVRKVNPPEQDRSVLRAGRAAPARVDTPESLLKVLRQKLAQMPRPTGAVQQATAIPARQITPAATQVENPTPANGRFLREGTGRSAPRAENRPEPQVVPTPQPRANGRFVRQTAGPRAVGTLYIVQIAAYSSRARADDLAKRAGEGARVQRGADGIYRVYFGPYGTEADAQKALVGAKARGHSGARIFVQ